MLRSPAGWFCLVMLPLIALLSVADPSHHATVADALHVPPTVPSSVSPSNLGSTPSSTCADSSQCSVRPRLQRRPSLYALHHPSRSRGSFTISMVPKPSAYTSQDGPSSSASNATTPDLLATPDANATSTTPDGVLPPATTITIPAAAVPSMSTVKINPLLSFLSKRMQVQPQDFLKIASLSSLLMLMIFIFVLSRDTKDTLIVTNCGAEAIAFLKVYGVIPAATMFMVVYSKLSNSLDPRQLFPVILTPFLLFFSLFGLVLYPMRHVLHGNPLLTAFIQQQPWLNSGRFVAVTKILQHWLFALFFIASELWGSAAVSLLFWTCANDSVRFDEAKRIYPWVTLIGNFGPLVSGVTLAAVSAWARQRVLIPSATTTAASLVSTDEQAFALSLRVLSMVTGVAGLVILGLHRFVVTRFPSPTIGTTPSTGVPSPTSTGVSNTNSTAVTPKTHKKPKMSLSDSLHFLRGHRYLRDIAVMVLSYGVSIECTEILWKSVVHRAIPVRTEYLAFMGRYSLLIGIASMVLMPLGSWMLQRLGWGAAALLTPVTMALLSLPFYLAVGMAHFKLSPTHTSALVQRKWWLMAVYVGLIQHVLTKAAKYSVFDPVKEMAYIPLDKEAKTKGKAAIDVLGARLGKSGGALMQQAVVLLCGGLVPGVPVIASVHYAVMWAWSKAVLQLAPALAEKDRAMQQSQQQQQEKPATAPQSQQ